MEFLSPDKPFAGFTPTYSTFNNNDSTHRSHHAIKSPPYSCCNQTVKSLHSLPATQRLNSPFCFNLLFVSIKLKTVRPLPHSDDPLHLNRRSCQQNTGI
ncbi:unnamed protein product [Ilex paraguariensis]|uniref:Uncharacterized protein n=1 Tax=Ilex paraguariensis TaxID=185542 RepID=A0ABC8UWM4_9AQUA